MRIEQNRKKLEKLYILGAGSSFSLSSKITGNPMGVKTTPLDKNFLATINEFEARNKWVENSVKHLAQNWVDERSIESHGLEEAIIKRIVQYDFLSKIHPQKTRSKSINSEYLNHLSHLITIILSKCRVNSRALDKKFMDFAFPKEFSALNQSNRIITLNYDTLLDSNLLSRKGYTPRQVYFDRLVNDESQGYGRTIGQKFDHPLILKLHGSINWHVRTDYFNSLIEDPDGLENQDKQPVWCDQKKVPAPEDNISPLIIPPLPNKPITQIGIFKYLWMTAYEYLHHAKEIVIVGYSCPQTDSIAHAMFSHFNNTEVERVIIVDPDATMLSKYRGIFKNKTSKGVRWQYYETFEEYINSECR